jgi:hypothetical protein
MKWTYLDPSSVHKDVFGFSRKIYALKVAMWHGKDDARLFRLYGWQTVASLLEFDPRTNKLLKHSKWFVFCAKGE